MSCEARELYLDRRLEPEARRAFEEHLAGCAACTREVDHLATIKLNLETWLTARVGPAGLVTPDLPALRTVARRHAVKRVGFAVGLAVAAAVAWLVIMPLAPRETPLELARNGGAALPVREPVILDAGETPLIAQLGPHRIGTPPGARLVVRHATERRTSVVLESGAAAFEVRRGEDGASFEVEAAGVSVRVVGTRFVVERTEDELVRVVVFRGTVDVASPNGLRRLRAGQSLRVAHRVMGETQPVTQEEEGRGAKLLAETTIVAPDNVVSATSDAPEVEEHDKRRSAVRPRAEPDYEQWSRWVSGNEARRAELALREHLRMRPDDVRARALLGDSLRKQERFKEAADAYAQAVREGRGAKAQRARFLLAVLQQDELDAPAQAAQALRDYLRFASKDDPVRPAALLRLGRSQLATGERPGAESTLRELIGAYPDLPESRDAQRLLQAP